MKLSDDQLRRYNERGFLNLPQGLCDDDVESLHREIDETAARESESRLLEPGGNAVRAIHGCHLQSDAMRRLTLRPEFLEPVRQILKSEVYVYQFKVNLKAAFEGSAWPWHQDFKHWHEEDGLLEPRAVNVAVYLDAMTSYNGPLFLIPGSHKQSNWCTQQQGSSGWSEKYRADLKYTVDRETLRRLAEQHGIVSAEAPKGNVLLFDVNVVHGSASNMSPFDRWLLIITYNSVENLPNPGCEPRPEFLVGRDSTPLVPQT